MKKKKEKKSNIAFDTDPPPLWAVVANINNKQVQVSIAGKSVPCLVPSSLAANRNSLAVGDRVKIVPAGDEQYKLLNIAPRITSLYRGDRRSPGEEVLIAANVQYLLVVVTADYLLNQAGFPEAAMIAGRRSGIDTGLYISKWDMIGDRAQALLRDKLTLYRATADSVFAGPAHKMKEELAEAVRGKAAVVIGDRGCGKTSLIQEILSILQGNTTNRMLQKSHTHHKNPASNTHSSILHAGPEETLLIDTPGFRDFALRKVAEEERNFVFPEIAGLAETCHFSNCRHTHEEGCQVIEAVRAGSINRVRYHAYQRISENAPESASRKSGSIRENYQHKACAESFVCKVCGTLVVPAGAGSLHRNHCPKCLSSIHLDDEPGDRASLCNGIMDPVSVWVRKGGEWAVIHRCRLCGTLSSNRIAADDNPILLMSIAVRPLSMPAFPLNDLTTL